MRFYARITAMDGAYRGYPAGKKSPAESFCLGRKAVTEKRNEITPIPEEILYKRADYVLVLKGNQENLHEEVSEYFAEDEFVKKIDAEGNYKMTVEKAHGQTEIWEGY